MGLWYYSREIFALQKGCTLLLALWIFNHVKFVSVWYGVFMQISLFTDLSMYVSVLGVSIVAYNKYVGTLMARCNSDI